MKTIDDFNYKPGMTLYATKDGVVTVCKTQEQTKHLPECAVGLDDRLHCINGHYAKRDSAYVVATNYWLKIIRGAEEQLKRLSAERDGRPYQEPPRA